MNQQKNFSIVKNRTIEEKEGKVLNFKSYFNVFPQVRKTKFYHLEILPNLPKDDIFAQFYSL